MGVSDFMHYVVVLGALGVFYYVVLTGHRTSSTAPPPALAKQLDKSQYTELHRVEHPHAASPLSSMKLPHDDTVLHSPGRMVSFGVPATR